MDRFEQLVSQSQFAVAVLLNADHTDCELVGVRPLTNRNLQAEMEYRHLHFVGIIAVVDGNPQHEWTEPLPESTLARLAGAFVAYFDVIFKDAKAKTDFKEFMDKLCALEDPR